MGAADRLLERTVATFGPDSDAHLGNRKMLAMALAENAAWDAAVPRLRRLIADLESSRGSEHPFTSRARAALEGAPPSEHVR